FFFQAEDGIRDFHVTGVQTCALPIFLALQLDDELASALGGGAGRGQRGGRARDGALLGGAGRVLHPGLGAPDGELADAADVVLQRGRAARGGGRDGGAGRGIHRRVGA